MEDWQVAAASTCEKYDAQLSEVEERLGSASTLDDIAAIFGEASPIMTEYTTAITSIELPESAAHEIQSLYDELNKQTGIFAALLEATRTGDQAEFERLVSEEMNPSGEATNQAAQDLGVPACADS